MSNGQESLPYSPAKAGTEIPLTTRNTFGLPYFFYLSFAMNASQCKASRRDPSYKTGFRYCVGPQHIYTLGAAPLTAQLIRLECNVRGQKIMSRHIYQVYVEQ